MIYATIHVGDALAVLRAMPAESVHCVVTSPPYWGLRDYGVDGQIGLEESFDEFLGKLVAVFAEVRRVLRGDGVCWVNMGDGYNGSSGNGGVTEKQSTNSGSFHNHGTRRVSSLKPKDIIGQPWRLAFSLQADGWWLRSDCIWHKPNPMPESVTDRPTKAHEYVFLLTKAARYYYDADAVRSDPKTIGLVQGSPGGSQKTRTDRDGASNDKDRSGKLCGIGGVNLRTVWTMPTQPFDGAHSATFPEALAERCIKAGCPEGGTVLDPFTGSGTTGVVAMKAGRNFLGIELNPTYAEMARKRIGGTLPLFSNVRIA